MSVAGGFAYAETPHNGLAILAYGAGGLTSPVLSRLAFANLPRPVYPLDPQTTREPPGPGRTGDMARGRPVT